MKFYSISTLRENIAKYLKNDSYTNCKNDLCNFFANKSFESICSLPILIVVNGNFKYIKSRIGNSNMNKGKSGGYRLYFYVDVENETIFLLGFYPKSGKYGCEDLTQTEEKQMIHAYNEEKNSKALIEHDMNNNFEEVKQKITKPQRV